MPRAVIHLNVAHFAVAVERVVDRRLRDRPVIVAPAGTVRAAVYDMSDEAYASGVRKGMALRRAQRRCPDAVVLPPHPDRYERAMRALIRQTRPYSPLIEPGRDDGHLFVDVSGTGRLFGPPADVAWRLRRRLRRELALNPVWAVAPNKLVAKVATRLVKPDGDCVIPAGREAATLAPLPVGLIPGIEARDLRLLREFNLTRVHQVTALDLEQLQVPFGPRAAFIRDILHGVDASPVRPVDRPPPHAAAAHEFGPDTNCSATLEAVLYRLTERVGRDLRRRLLAARRLVLVLDHSDGIRRMRQLRLAPPTANDFALFEAARHTLGRLHTRRVRVRHIRLRLDRLVFPPAQQALFTTERAAAARREAVVDAIDRVRERFGPEAVRMGRTLGLGTAMMNAE